jgi:hypothetical protein
LNAWPLILVLAAAPPGSNEVEAQGVRVVTSIRSNVYTWDITNQGVPPISTIEIPAHHMYTPRVPPGWRHNELHGAEVFRAWTADDRSAIRAGQTKRFTATVTVSDAVIGHVPMTLGSSGGATLTVAGVWGATPKPRGPVVLVTVLLAGLAFTHAGLGALRERRREVTPAPPPSPARPS